MSTLAPSPSRRGVAAILLVFVALVAAAIGLPYWQHYEAPWREPVLRVGEREVTLEEFWPLLRPALAAGRQDQGADPMGLAVQRLHRLRDDLLILADARRRGLAPSEAEISALIQAQIGETNPGAQDQPERLSARLRRLGMSEDAYREQAAIRLVQQRLSRELGQGVRGWLTETRARAQAAGELEWRWTSAHQALISERMRGRR